MKRTSALLRNSLVLAAGLLAGVFAVPAAASAGTATSFSQTFSADSGDACPHGVTRGTLAWTPNATPLPTDRYYTETAVEVDGTVLDQPVNGATTSTACGPDVYQSTASFTVYDMPAGPPTFPPNPGTALSTDSVTVDNGTASFHFVLPVTEQVPAIDYLTLVVQVCRSPVDPRIAAPSYCGPAQTYFAPGPPVAHPLG